MIKNKQYHSLFMDFSSFTETNHHPCDIDMFYLGKDNTAIFGEIKNELGTLNIGQRGLLEKLSKGWKDESLCLFITHNKYAQYGDTEVDVPECYVKEYYYNKTRRWHKPKKPIKVKEVLSMYSNINEAQNKKYL